MVISMLKIRRPLGRLIFNMGIAIPGKTVFLIETAPRYQGRGTFMTWQLELLSRLAMELCLNLFHWFIPESSYCTLSQWCTAPWDRSAFKMTMHGKSSKFHRMFEFPMVDMNKVWGPCCHLTSAYNLWDYIHLICNTFAIPNYTT